MSRALFLGTPAAAVPALHALHRLVEVVAVVTRSDKPRGRSGTPRPSAVKQAALDLGLHVAGPETQDELRTTLHRVTADVGVVVAYGRILPADLLGIPRRGFVNAHFSLLPRWRGAAPVARAIMAGDSHTGVTMIQMDEGLDTGPILARSEPVEIGERTRGMLTAELADVAAGMLTAHLPRHLAGQITAQPQDHSAAVLAPKLRGEETRLDISAPAERLHRHVRALSPEPGAWAEVDGRRLKVLEVGRMRPLQRAPGEVFEADGSVWLAAEDGAIELLTVHPEGRARVSATAWWNGRRGRPTRLQ